MLLYVYSNVCTVVINQYKYFTVNKVVHVWSKAGLHVCLTAVSTLCRERGNHL